MKEVDKIYVIVKDKEGNFHQLNDINEVIKAFLLTTTPVYSNHNFTKECVEDLKKITNQI